MRHFWLLMVEISVHLPGNQRCSADPVLGLPASKVGSVCQRAKTGVAGVTRVRIWISSSENGQDCTSLSVQSGVAVCHRVLP